MADEASNFFSRWSKRKAQVRAEVQALDQTPVQIQPPAAADAKAREHPHPSPLPQAGEGAIPGAPPAVQAPAAPPTLADVAQLTRESDYSRFMAGNVSPEVKNAALKQLFTDPHFNVMDGLDTYIDDYNTPDPLPAGMLRQMVQSHLLGLFDDEKKPDSGADELDGLATSTTSATTATPAPTASPALPQATPHEDPDMQLQPDDVAGRAGTEPGPGENAGRPH